MEGIFIFVLNHVSKIYGAKGETIALDDISFSFPPKGIFAIVGKSGSGKSTLLNLLSLLAEPTSGEILFLGKNLSSMSEDEKSHYRNCVCGFIHQKFNLLENENVINNIMFPCLIHGESFKEAQRRSLSLLERFGLLPLKDRVVASLSGGEKQRVAILRSLINEPLVLFCDEPTGALDEKNSLLVMDILKDIAKEKLVILVSHNPKIVEQYASHRLTLKDGKIIGDIEKFSCDKVAIKIVKRQKGSSWKKHLILRHLKEDKKKNILSFLSSTIAFLFLLCSLGFIYGSQDSLNDEKEKTLLLYQGSVSKKETFAIDDSPLSLTRSSRPMKEEAIELLDGTGVSVHNDYSYFFPKETTFESEGISTHASFEPIFDFSLQELGRDLIQEGGPPTDDESSRCYVNDVFFERFCIGVGKKIRVPMKINLVMDKENIVVNVGNEFIVTGVIKEFGFLNVPRIYYSYGSFEERLKKTYLKSSSNRKSVYALVEEASNSDPVSSYSYLLYAHDETSKEKLFSLAGSTNGNENGLEISSYSYSLISSFDSLHQALSAVLLPFLFLALFASSFISGSISFSSFLEKKKEAAILTSLGAPFSSIISIYVSESLIVFLSSALVSLFLGYFLEMLLNPFLLYLSDIPSLIQIPYLNFAGIPFFLPLLSLIIAAFLAFIGTFIPIVVFKRSALIKELNDE